MELVEIKMKGIKLNFDLAEKIASTVAEQGNMEPMLLAWFDKKRDVHSPSGVKCEIKGEPGWEVYGRNHGGQYRISINSDEYVFIYC